MPHFTTQRHVPYTADQMFDLVADVEAYPEFLPLCEALQVRARDVRNGLPVVVADMTVGYKAITETFTSQVLLDRHNRSIQVSYIDGPFSHLRNDWNFKDAGQGCAVEFQIDYAFKSPMLGMLIGGLFDKAFRKFAQAFEDRARKVYGVQAETPEWLNETYRR